LIKTDHSSVIDRLIRFFTLDSPRLLARYGMLIVFLVALGDISGQAPSICKKAQDIYSTISEYHIAPKPVDDTLSSIIFSKFIEFLDPNKLLFTKDDLKYLSKYELQFDDVIEGRSCEIIDEIANFYISKSDALRSKVMSITANDIQIQTIDTLHFGHEQFSDANELESMWKKMFKMKVLLQIADEETGIKQNEITKEIVQHKLENIIAAELCIIEDKYNIDNTAERKKVIFRDLLRAVTESMDPHTAFMTMDEKVSFLESLQTETLTFGFALVANLKGEYEISNIIPGGPAWGSNLIEEQDQFIGIKDTKGTTIRANCTNISTISEHLQSNEVREVIFIIKNKLGKKMEVPLSKDFQTVDENIIQSFVLQGEQKLGYIQLPSFYSSSDTYSDIPNGCADDIARELIRLQQENIDGLILDLRFNGGGAILEAIRMTGMFINYGPVAIAEYRDEEPQTLKDMERGIGYRGPLTILVNSFSASASELFVGALQDYNRAIVVGTPTHGKGSIQTIMPSNAYELTEESMADDISPDFLKTTIGKYYRINGAGVQGVGIVPDIVIPDLFDLEIFRERSNKTALPYSTINKKTYYKPLKKLPIEQLQANSEIRISENTNYRKIDEVRQELFANQTHPYFILELENIRKLQDESEFDVESETVNLYKISLPTHKQKLLQQDQYQLNQSKIVQEALLQDLQLLEAYHITSELITITK